MCVITEKSTTSLFTDNLFSRNLEEGIFHFYSICSIVIHVFTLRPSLLTFGTGYMVDSDTPSCGRFCTEKQFFYEKNHFLIILSQTKYSNFDQISSTNLTDVSGLFQIFSLIWED